jgi:hypothetical protein
MNNHDHLARVQDDDLRRLVVYLDGVHEGLVDKPVGATMVQGWTSARLKELNEAKRRARPTPDTSNAGSNQEAAQPLPAWVAVNTSGSPTPTIRCVWLGRVEIGAVPFEVPAGWRFEVTSG